MGGYLSRSIFAPLKRQLPGFAPALAFTWVYLGLIVLLPLSELVIETTKISPAHFLEILSSPRVLAAFRVSIVSAFLAACVNVFFGSLVAWVLVRYRFPGRQLVDALVDLPFAFPTAVAGIALTGLYSPEGWLGKALGVLGIQVAYRPLGIVVALVFIGLPFVVRTVQPVLQEMDPEVEGAAASLGASRPYLLRRILLPPLTPALLTGFAMAFARGLGEYGSVIFIAGNLPMVSEIVPLLIVIELEEFQYADATAIALVMLATSFFLLFLINVLQKWSRRYD